MKTINIHTLLSLLGKPLSSLEVENFLNEIGVKRRPHLDENDITNDIYNQWLPIKRLGLELEFKNKAMFESLDETKVNQTPLILTSYIFYSDMEGIKDYPYELPYGITFNDSKNQVRKKLESFKGIPKFYVRDVWIFDDHRLIISYGDDNSVIDVTYMLYSNVPEEIKTPLSLDIDNVVSVFGEKPNSKNLSHLFNFIDLNDFTKKQDKVTPRSLAKKYGLGLDFSDASYFNDVKEDGEIFTEMVFYREGYLDFSYGYNGMLPLNIDFDDSPVEFFAKVNQTPVDHYELASKLEGHILWVFEKFSLRVVYSLLLNNIARIHIYPHWYWDEDDKKGWKIEKTFIKIK